MDNKYKSECTNLLLTSLAKAQGAYKVPTLNEHSARGSYSNLFAILEAAKEALSENGLSIFWNIELLDEGSGASLLWATLGHCSGQYIRSACRIIKEETFVQTWNNTEAYKRLHAYLLLGMAPVGTDPLFYDDNGVTESERVRVRNIRENKPVTISHITDSISTDEYDDIMWELKDDTDMVISIQKYYGISSIADLPKSEYHQAKAKIRKIKQTHADYKKTKDS